MLYSVRMISANMVSVIVKFLLFKEGYLVEMPTLLMFLLVNIKGYTLVNHEAVINYTTSSPVDHYHFTGDI